MNGYNVLHPMGYDAFGLPTENFALKIKKNPLTFVPKYIERFRKQLRSIGFSYDWQREIATTDPEFYKWTQLMFLKMYEKGLVYEKEAPINFCPSCKTGLADEEAIGGRCDRCGSQTEIKFFKTMAH
jgi:leucyl-tRNA synthetase